MDLYQNHQSVSAKRSAPLDKSCPHSGGSELELALSLQTSAFAC